jgi:hypothetical protein
MERSPEPHPPAEHRDWTWVLDEVCPQCGYDARSVDRDQIGALMRANAAGFRAALERGSMVTRRPPVAAGETIRWSALEYAGHVHDVYRLAEDRLGRMLRRRLLGRGEVTFPDWDQNQAAIDGDYGAADPAKVAYRLADQAGKVADMVDRIRGDQWDRTGTRSDGHVFTVDALARYMLHDVTHHLWDVEQGYEAITAADKAARKARRAAELAGDDPGGQDDAGGDEGAGR